MNAQFIFSLAVVALCSGCGTVLSHTAKTSVVGPYSGVRLDYHVAVSSTKPVQARPAVHWIIPFCIIDMPPSVALDTIFLPYDLFQHQPESPPSSDTHK